MRTVPPIAASYAGVDLSVVRIQDRSGRIWVQHSYLGRDGVELEDMGRRPAEFDVEIVFYGSAWYDSLRQLREAIESRRESSERVAFVHPFWGRLYGVAAELEVTHEDQRHDVAFARFHFTEGTRAGAAFELDVALASSAAGAAQASAAARAAAAALEDA